MSGYALAFAVLYLGISTLHDTRGESISNGKDAKQSSTIGTYVAGFALNMTYLTVGAMTNAGNPSWWEVDLRGYFTISNITLTSVPHGGQNSDMTNVSVEVMDKDFSLCAGVQVVWCGDVPSTITPGDKFTFTCNATFPVRFVRVTRRSTRNVYLRIGHVDVQGEGTMKPCCSYYTSSKNVKVSEPFLTTSAMTVGYCGIVCNEHHSCIDFSYSATAPTDENCLLTDKALSSHHVNDNSWTTYTIYYGCKHDGAVSCATVIGSRTISSITR